MLLHGAWAPLCVDALERAAQAFDFDLEAYCGMPNHMHVLAAAAEESCDLRSFVRHFKQVVGYAYRRSNHVPLWHRSYYDHVLRPSEDWRHHAAYIFSNPVAAGLVRTLEAWPYSGPRSAIEDARPLTGQESRAIAEVVEGRDRPEGLSVRSRKESCRVARAEMRPS